MKVLILTNVPSPYRFTLFDQIEKLNQIELLVVYTGIELSNLKWYTPNLSHNHKYLKIPQNKILKKMGYRKGIRKILSDFSPDAIVTGGFSIVMLTAIIYSYLYSRKHFITTDAWEYTEKNYSFLHILIRKFIYKKATGFFPVSIKGKNNIVENYKSSENKVHVIPYTPSINNFYSKEFEKKEFDIMFSGQFTERKMPLFVCEIAKEIKKKGIDIKVLLLGSGELSKEAVSSLASENIEYEYPGFVQTDKLPDYFSKAKLFLFPTLSDGWGVVANEALAAGLPIITCDNAGSAGELIINNFNGFILSLEINEWVEKVNLLLNDEDLYNEFSINAKDHVTKFNVEKAATDFINATLN